MRCKRVMALLLMLLLALPAGVPPAGAAEEETPPAAYMQRLCTSPDGSVAIWFGLEEGTPRYAVTKAGEAVILPSALGIVADSGDFSAGVVSAKPSTARRISDSYTMQAAKAAVYSYTGYEVQVLLTAVSGGVCTLTFRCFDNGLAYRYDLGFTQVSVEASSYTLAGDWTVCHSRWWSVNYETLYTKSPASALPGDSADLFNMPLLYETSGDCYVLLSEANLNGGYAGSGFAAEAHGENTVLSYRFTPEQTGKVELTDGVTPWRFAVIGDLSAVMENHMAEDLSDPPDETMDYSFAKPGAVSWSWLDDAFDGTQQEKQRDTGVIKTYIDLAAEMGWSYYLLDEGWQPAASDGSRYLGYYDNFTEIAAYAKEKGIGLIVWVHSDDLNTAERRAARLPDWAARGIAGIKVDFFDNENQETLRLYDELYRECAELGLVVNCHGANKSTGELRTHPNVLTREAIRGQEYGPVTANDFVYLGYTRLAVGTADITEYLIPRGSDVRMGFQLALGYIALNGLHTLAISCNDVEKTPYVSLLRDFPTSFEETRFLGGEVGSDLTIARRFGDEWVVAGMANQDKEIELDFSFLEAGEQYLAVLYNDGASNAELSVSATAVTADTRLPVQIKSGGGFLLRLLPGDTKLEGVSAVEIQTPATRMTVGESLPLSVGFTADVDAAPALRYASSDSGIIEVGADGTLRAVNAGRAVITVSSYFDDNVCDTVEITAGLPLWEVSSDWTIQNSRPENVAVQNDGGLTLTMTGGDPGKNSGITNLFCQTTEDEAFTLTVKTTGGFDGRYQTVALCAMTDTDNLIAAMRRYHDGLGVAGTNNCFEALRYEGDYHEPAVADLQKDAPAWLRLEKRADGFTAWYSYDGVQFEKIADGTLPASFAGAGSLRIGVYVTSGIGTNNTAATLSDLTYTAGEEIRPLPLTVEIDYSDLYGDVDGDGGVTVSDVVALRQMIVAGSGGYDASAFTAGDLDGDYLLSVSDVVALRGRIVSGKGEG